jgi:hypothetical protein
MGDNRHAQIIPEVLFLGLQCFEDSGFERVNEPSLMKASRHKYSVIVKISNTYVRLSTGQTHPIHKSLWQSRQTLKRPALATMLFFCQLVAVGFSPQRKASIRQTLKRPARAVMLFFCQPVAVGFSPQRKASIRQTLKRPARAMMLFFLSASSCGLQPAAESVYTPDAKASG